MRGSHRGRRKRVEALLTAVLTGGAVLAGAGTSSAAPPSVLGMDVSDHQPELDWSHWWDEGMRFAFIKATEGTGYTSPSFSEQYAGATQVGMLRGPYHFALPDRSTGADQAEYFIDNGGGWTPDGRTLPGAVDLESAPNGPTCYGMSPDQMGAWIMDFSNHYRARTGRKPVVYTTTNWWDQCVSGISAAEVSAHPLWLAHPGAHVGPVPHGWEWHTFWQHDTNPIDQDKFNGTIEQLRALAAG